MHSAKWLALALSALALTACDRSQQQQNAKGPTPAPTAPAAVGDSAAIAAAIDSPDRLEGDRDQDSWRKPGEVLSFLQVRPGMQVLDYFAAGGYYTELLSRAVGPQGKVIAYNNAPYLKYSGEQPARRYGENRLGNVVQLTTPTEDVPLDPNSLDAALFMQSYHDLYWRPKDGSWPPTDPATALAELVPALKAGAVVVVVDHVAAEGSDPAASVDSMHRIDPAILKRDFAAAGLELDGESAVFRNSADDHTKEVFDASIRRKTDQVMYRFRKR